MSGKRFSDDSIDERLISGNIKKIRTSKKMTLQDLADRTGLTKGYLSKVERSDKAPPYSTLNKIAGALSVEVTTLFNSTAGPVHDGTIVFGRKKDDKLVRESSDLAGYDYTVLGAGKPGRNMEPFLIYAPFSLQKMYEHEGEEFFYVLEGRLEFHYGETKYTMEAGDHVYFDSRIPHSGFSLGDTKAKLLVVIYFYKRNRQ
ncbi:helix-turn-helix domain-containing protein [Desulfogranum japonicum]|uniref:helix-turn-helix domain-containing protein n=1 Tax=Desulfogranum japonicum TaxID=231447 RepID=UPI000401A4DC|nr:XRE family transcriptional regulator [Desulfogranum japonicum]